MLSETTAQTIYQDVDYSDYQARDMRNVMQSETDNFFHGILNYIGFKSRNLYNTREFLISCRGIQPGSDPANILDSRTNAVYESGVGPGQCLMITFQRIQVRPTAYAIKTGPLNRTTRHLNAYVFQGWDRRRGDWVTIDERQSLLELLPGYTSRLSHVDTGGYFQKFRLLQTDPFPPPGTRFAICAFEIHGTIITPQEPRQMNDLPDESDVIFDFWSLPETE
jgi:hypothetical protein